MLRVYTYTIRRLLFRSTHFPPGSRNVGCVGQVTSSAGPSSVHPGSGGQHVPTAPNGSGRSPQHSALMNRPMILPNRSPVSSTWVPGFLVHPTLEYPALPDFHYQLLDLNSIHGKLLWSLPLRFGEKLPKKASSLWTTCGQPIRCMACPSPPRPSTTEPRRRPPSPCRRGSWDSVSACPCVARRGERGERVAR